MHCPSESCSAVDKSLRHQQRVFFSAGQSQHQCCHYPYGRRLWLELHSLRPGAVQLLLWLHDDSDSRRIHHLQAGWPRSPALRGGPLVSCHRSCSCLGRHHARCAHAFDLTSINGQTAKAATVTCSRHHARCAQAFSWNATASKAGKAATVTCSVPW